jgi:hypothetical protein
MGELLVATALVEESLRTLDPREKFGIVACLHALGMVASQESAAERAAILFGASHKLREEIGAPIPPFEQDEYEKEALQVRTQLGEAEFTRLVAEGGSLTVDAAISYARARTPVALEASPSVPVKDGRDGAVPSSSGGGSGWGR